MRDRRIILAFSFLKKDHPRMILPGKRMGKDDPSKLASLDNFEKPARKNLINTKN